MQRPMILVGCQIGLASARSNEKSHRKTCGHERTHEKHTEGWNDTMCELYCNLFDSFVRSAFNLLGNSTPDVQVNVLGASEQANSGEQVIWSEIRQAFETMSPTIQTTFSKMASCSAERAATVWLAIRSSVGLKSECTKQSRHESFRNTRRGA